MSRNTSIRIGGWWLELSDLTLRHENLHGYWVDALEIGGHEIVKWVKHLSTKSGVLTARDIRDFAKMALLAHSTDLTTLRDAVRANKSVIMREVKDAGQRMTRSRRIHRAVAKLMKQRGLGPAISLRMLEQLEREAMQQGLN